MHVCQNELILSRHKLSSAGRRVFSATCLQGVQKNAVTLPQFFQKSAGEKNMEWTPYMMSAESEYITGILESIQREDPCQRVRGETGP